MWVGGGVEGGEHVEVSGCPTYTHDKYQQFSSRDVQQVWRWEWRPISVHFEWGTNVGLQVSSFLSKKFCEERITSFVG
jgi:hypothetical protein